MRFTDIKDFHIHVIFAADKLIAGRPEAVRAFLQGWFETIAFMRTNKAVAIAKEVTNKDEEITARVYDELMPMFSDDGKFSPSALATLAKSYVELQLLRRSRSRQAVYRGVPAEAVTPPASGCTGRGGRAWTRSSGDWIFGGVTHQLLASSPVSACCRIEALR